LAGNQGGSFANYKISSPSAAAVTLNLSYSPFDAVAAHAIGVNVYQAGSKLAGGTGKSAALGDASSSSSVSLSFTPSASGGPVSVQVFNYSPATISYTLTSSLAATAAVAAPSISSAQARYVYVGTYTSPNKAPGGLVPSTAVGIYVFKMDPKTGGLTQIQVVPNQPNPSFLVLDPKGKYLYATNEVSTWKGQDKTGGVNAFSIDQTTGMLTLLNDQPSMGAIPARPNVDPTGSYVVVANYIGANFSVLPIKSDGSLGPATDVFNVTGKGPNKARQEAPHPHDVEFDPAGGFVIGNDLGTDKVWVWHLDTTAGKLVPADVPYVQVASGSGPRHSTFHPSGKFAYVIDEMVSSITAFAYDGATGSMIWIQTISTLPASFTGTSSTAEIIMHPSGKFVYGSNRGHDSIAGFAIDPASGKLTSTGWTSTQGKVPRGFNIDPSGSLLLAGNQNSDSIVPFIIDQSTGNLTPTGAITSTPVPVSIQFGPVIK
jgi:6-phosphogluconolactonase